MSSLKEYEVQSYEDIESRAKRLEALINLSNDMKEKEMRMPIPFNDFLYLASTNPYIVFRDIFQLFYDMMHYYVPEGEEEYPDSTESIGFVRYDTTNLFVTNCDNPFFADRLFANRLLNLVEGFKQGSLHNHIILFEGPPGSGKSTFLNNLMLKMEEYTKIPEGSLYKVYWRLDIEKLGGFQKIEKSLYKAAENGEDENFFDTIANNYVNGGEYPKKYLDFACPKHDHPILLIPKSYRKKFLDELIPDANFKEKLFTKKEYEWVLKDIPCTICKSLYSILLDKIGNPLEVFNMINARRSEFNRQLGEGISVFNPGDPITRKPLNRPILQAMINNLLKTDNIDFVFSDLAKTNNGILALMDIKELNVERLMNLHGIISDGVHKVELIEEHIKSMFVGLVNPEDKIHYEKIKSFQDRIVTTKIPYILDYNTEVAIYKNKFGEDIESKFLPGVLENFAKIIISSRLDRESPSVRRWIQRPEQYSKYVDKHLLLLKMDIYTGIIPTWLSEEDYKRFNRDTRKDVISASELEGNRGFSGRQSLKIFANFMSKYGRSNKLITMEMVREFFTVDSDELRREIPEGFVDSLVDMYDYNVLQEVKESIYYYNELQISRDIQNYLFSINFDPGETVRSNYTGDVIEVNEEYLKNFEAMFLGTTSSSEQRRTFRQDVHNEYVSKTLAREMNLLGKAITETEQYHNLFDRYTRNLKENALAPYIENENFRRAIMDYGTGSFNTYDERLKRDVNLLISKLKNKFKYTNEGAKQIAIYVLDKKLAKKY